MILNINLIFTDQERWPWIAIINPGSGSTSYSVYQRTRLSAEQVEMIRAWCTEQWGPESRGFDDLTRTWAYVTNSLTFSTHEQSLLFRLFWHGQDI